VYMQSKHRLCIVALVMLAFVLSASPVCAVKTIAVSNSVHNLSMSAPDIPGLFANPYRSTNVTEVCIFCHTPHAADTSATAPLWNRQNPDAGSFTMYVSSRSGSAASSGRSLNGESLVCLSCHDGSIATNAVLNWGNDEGYSIPEGGDPAYINIITDGVPNVVPAILGARIGAAKGADGMVLSPDTGHLEDDHPISINYTTTLGTSYASEFHSIGEAQTAGVRFFNGSYVECSSCHDPHVSYDFALGGDPDYTPFLVIPNTNSDLCYACHIK